MVGFKVVIVNNSKNVLLHLVIRFDVTIRTRNFFNLLPMDYLI